MFSWNMFNKPGGSLSRSNYGGLSKIFLFPVVANLHKIENVEIFPDILVNLGMELRIFSMTFVEN